MPSPFFCTVILRETSAKVLPARLRLPLLEWRKDLPGFSHPCG